MSWIAKNLTRDGDGDYSYLDKEGVSWDTPADALGVSVLGFCGCGAPEVALRYVRDALRLVAMKHEGSADSFHGWYEKIYRPAVDELFHADAGAEYLMWYFLDDKGLAEHGGSVPGWLTAFGEDVLSDLDAMDLDAEIAA